MLSCNEPDRSIVLVKTGYEVYRLHDMTKVVGCEDIFDNSYYEMVTSLITGERNWFKEVEVDERIRTEEIL